jgi:hypothetical protein
MNYPRACLPSAYHHDAVETATRPDPDTPCRAFFFPGRCRTGGATQLAVITTPSHMILPSRRCVQGRVKLWTLTRTQRAGTMNPECRTDIHPVKETRIARSTILLIERDAPLRVAETIADSIKSSASRIRSLTSVSQRRDILACA